MGQVDFLQPKGIDDFAELGINLVSGINEFLDNAIEAKAENIIIKFINNKDFTKIIIIEDGIGMDGETLQYALTFGGEGGKIRNKTVNDLGKFHAGMTLAGLSLSNQMNVFSNKGDGWNKNSLNKESLKRDGKINDSKQTELPSEIKDILIDIEKTKGIKINTGTIVSLEDINTKLIGPTNFYLEVEELFNNCCMRYYKYLDDEKNSIYIMLNDTEEFKKCESINPLLKNNKLLNENELEICANFKYENILTVKEVIPTSNIDATMDIELVVIRNKNGGRQRGDCHTLVKCNMENQGTYFARNDLVLIRAEKIGYGKRHNDFNGVRAYINLNGDWDDVLGININKSHVSMNSKCYELLNYRLSNVYTNIRKFVRNKKSIEIPVIQIKDSKDYQRECKPQIFKVPINRDNSGGDEGFHGGSDVIGGVSNGNGGSHGTDDNPYGKNDTKEKNKIIFAANKKPNIILNLSEKLDIDIKEEDNNYYIYNQKIGKKGVRKEDIEKW